MSGFLARLAERQIARTPGVAPRLPSRFDPPPMVPLEPETVAAAPEHTPGDAPSPPRRAAAVSPDADRDEPRPAAPGVRHEPDRQAAPADAKPAPDVTSPARLPERPVSRSEPTPRADVGEPRTVAIVERVVPVRGEGAEESRVAPPAPAAASRADGPHGESAAPRVRSLEPLVPVTPAASVPVQAFPVERPPDADHEPPVVHVTIGRLEVRAALPAPPVPNRRRPPERKALSLEEYLDRRHGARR